MKRLVTTVTAIALLLGIAFVSPASAAERRPTDSTPVALSAAHAAELQALLATDEGREEVFGALSRSFGTVLTEAPTHPYVTRADMVHRLAYGYDRDHVWMTASYADIARGLLSAAVVACKRYLPAIPWVCDWAGGVLKSWARGYPALANHGVWGALYTTGRFTGGRW
jgi:hypothetical protein